MSERVPEGWSLKTLGDLAKVKRGASPRPIQDPKWWGGTVGWTRISDVTSSSKYLTETSDYLSDEGVEKSVQIPVGEVILSICATIGRPIIVKTDVCIHDGFVWFDGLSNDIDREFYYYFLKSKEEILSSSRQTGTQGNLNTDIVSRLPIHLPPLPEQKKIASILTSVDEVIEKTQSQIDKLQDLKKGTMNELLTKGIGHTEFKDSELGRIPKSWEVKTLIAVAQEKGIQTGPFGSQLHAHEYTLDGIPVVMPKDMKSPLVDISSIARIPENRAIDLSKHRVEEGDILFSRRGDIGRFALMDTSSKGWVCGTGCLRVRLENKVVHPYFVAQYLTKDEPIEWLNLNAVGLTMLNLSTSILEGLPLIVPPLEEQMTIVDALQSIDARFIKCRDYLSQTQSLKKSLMQDLLTGKVRVSVN